MQHVRPSLPNSDAVILLPGQSAQMTPNMRLSYSNEGKICISHEDATACMSVDIPKDIKEHYLATDGVILNVYSGLPTSKDLGKQLGSFINSEFTRQLVTGTEFDKFRGGFKLSEEFSNAIKSNPALNQYKIFH